VTRFVEPLTIEEACSALAADPWGAKALAGGTALVLMMRQGLVNPKTLVSLGALQHLRGIEAEDGFIRIGARTTLNEVAVSPIVSALSPSLAAACSLVGNIRIRNLATLGGNLAEADYASDPPSVLVGMDATCIVQGSSAQRIVPVGELITGFYSTSLAPDEIITAVLLPVAGDAHRRSSYKKYVSRSSEDRPCVGVAVMADFNAGVVAHLSVVVGAVAEVPQRFDELVTPAIGRPLDQQTVSEIAGAYAAAIDPMEDARGSAWYRRQVTEVFIRRALEEVASP